MRIIRGLSDLKSFDSGCVATIGNFDGVHLGHVAVIQNLEKQGRRLGLPVVVILFEPQPLEYFQPQQVPARLSSLREKVLRLSQWPVDRVFLIRFNQAFATVEPEAFIKDYLIDGLQIQYLVIGDDFRFGKQRRGDFEMLKSAGQQAGFSVKDTRSFLVGEQRVSSTQIRLALQQGDLMQAQQLLGRPYSVCGRIAHGDKRGRSIGFPTANIRMMRKNTPVHGVFAVTMTGINDTAMPGVANVGVRPTAGGGSVVWLETHLFDFSDDIYGRMVEVHFHQKIRDECRFDSFDELVLQIPLDINCARNILNLPIP